MVVWITFTIGLYLARPRPLSAEGKVKMPGFVGVIVSDPRLQSPFTQVELRTLKSRFLSVRTQSGCVTKGDLPALFVKLKTFSETFTEDEIKTVLDEDSKDMGQEIDFEYFLRVSL
ncbi:EF-hand domain pair [Trema orientale]|uniref:EF-hand domain pair n=1 Tax=Trema orientale TaxID=63057 RepID=A0A2P5C4Y3_TREOI|nr:EF-hand domain pair [Trema orientale]